VDVRIEIATVEPLEIKAPIDAWHRIRQLRRPIVWDNNNNKHAYAVELNSFTHMKALLVLRDHCLVWRSGSHHIRPSFPLLKSYSALPVTPWPRR
jgi:hypothetical protein